LSNTSNNAFAFPVSPTEERTYYPGQPADCPSNSKGNRGMELRRELDEQFIKLLEQLRELQEMVNQTGG
jgi:hypothetical protein